MSTASVASSEYDELAFAKDLLPSVGRISRPGFAVLNAEVVGRGSYNFLIMVELLIEGGESDKAALRIPGSYKNDNGTWEMRDRHEIKDHAAVLLLFRLLKHIFDYRVPRVLEYNVKGGDTNPLGFPYLLLDYIPGDCMWSIQDKLSPAQRIHIMHQVIDIKQKLEKIKFGGAGYVDAGETFPDVMQFSNNKPSQKVRGNISGFRCEDADGPEHIAAEPSTNLRDLIFRQLQIWDDYAETDNNPGEGKGGHTDRLYRMLWIIAGDMDNLGFFDGDSAISLHHPDFYPRNLVISPFDPKADSPGNRNETDYDEPKTHAYIAGIIDWEGAVAVPVVLSRQPPTWLWHGGDPEPEFPTGTINPNDADWLPTDTYHCGAPLAAGDRAIKEAFDASMEAALPGYLEDAYGKGRWIRRLWRLMFDGFGDSSAEKRLYMFYLEWKEYFETKQLEQHRKEQMVYDGKQLKKTIARMNKSSAKMKTRAAKLRKRYKTIQKYISKLKAQSVARDTRPWQSAIRN